MADTRYESHARGSHQTPTDRFIRKPAWKWGVARAADGEFAVMKNHLPLAAALEMCPVRIS